MSKIYAQCHFYATRHTISRSFGMPSSFSDLTFKKKINDLIAHTFLTLENALFVCLLLNAYFFTFAFDVDWKQNYRPRCQVNQIGVD